MGHARLAPSSAGRWAHCPGSVSLEERFPDDGKDGAAGEASHWVASELLAYGRAHRVGETAPNGVVLDAEMVAGAQVYVDAVSTAAPVGEVGPMRVEQQITCELIHPECYGTPDLAYYQRGTQGIETHVWDYKYGWGIVEAIENWQLLTYASGLVESSSDVVVLHIVQPRPYHPLGPVREWRISAAELQQYVTRLSTAAHNALSGAPVCNTGSHCKYCKARHACRAAQLSAYAAIDYSEQATVQELDPQELAIELDALERAGEAIKYRLTGLTAQAIATVQNGGFIPGWTVQRGQGRSGWTVPAEQVFAVGKLLGVELQADPTPITPVQAKKKGVPAEVISSMSATPLGEAKLIRDNKTIAATIFGEAARQGA